MPDKYRTSGITWLDVQDLQDEMARRHWCTVVIHVGTMTPQGTKKRVGIWAVEFVRHKGTKREKSLAYCSDYWPSHISKSVPGMVHRLLWEASEMCEKRAEEEKRSRQIPLVFP